jgi:hypothetical protein
MEMSEVRRRINGIPNRNHRNIVSFCTVRDEDWDFDALCLNLERLSGVDLPFVASEMKIMESSAMSTAATNLPISRAARMFARHSLLNMPDFGDDITAEEDEQHWCDNLIGALKSVRDIRREGAVPVQEDGFEEALLNLTFELLNEFHEDHASHYTMFTAFNLPNGTHSSSRRLSDPQLINLIGERPQDWERVADLIISGVTEAVSITAVLDGKVIQPLASGAL